MGTIIGETIDIRLNEKEIKETLLKLIPLQKKNGRIYASDIRNQHEDPLLLKKCINCLLGEKYIEFGEGRIGIPFINKNYKEWYTITGKGKTLVEKQ